MNRKVALMVCTQARGGMLSVVEAYERDKIFNEWAFRSLWTHREGTVPLRAAVALRAYLQMLWLLMLGRVSFMHVHAAMRGSFWRKTLFVRTARWFGVPSIIHLHGSEMQTFYQSLSAARQKAVRLALEKADAVVVLSDSWQSFVREIAPQAKITVVNNYVALPSLRATPAAHISGSSFSVLFLGMLGRRKGIYDLLASWPAITAEIPGARLLIGGNGEIDAARLRAAELGITGSVDFLGWVDGDRKVALLKNSDVFVLPSYNEGLPMSVLEAMSWGKPVITTKVGGIPELITSGKDGILVDAGNREQLSDALLAFGHDAAFRELIGSAARERIEANFSDVAVLPSLDLLYRQISRAEAAASTV
jgi:glycosyltransferase involved in cell wall biosynthesis